MTEDARNTMTDQPQRSIVARTIGEQAVLSVIGGGPGQRGPWPYVTGIPNLDFDMVGPPPQYLSVAALGCLNGGHSGGRCLPGPDCAGGHQGRFAF